MAESSYPRLSVLFGAYMYQDWDMEADDWRGLVLDYAGHQRGAGREETAAEIDRLLASTPDDANLEDVVYRELGCYYHPRPDLGGPTVRAWLGEVTEFLRRDAARD